MARIVSDAELDAMSDQELIALLEDVMFKIRQRDAQQMKKDFVSNSQRLMLDEYLARRNRER